MNNALNVLGIMETDVPIDWKDIKHQYRIHALMYHPDKNKSEDASKKFMEIQEAYEYLEKRWNVEDMESNVDSRSYTDILHSVLNILAKNQKINEILENILSLCETQSIRILENMDNRKFHLVYVILKKYKNVFYLSDHFYLEMEKIRETHQSQPPIKETLEIITLKPTMDDLWENLVYKYMRDDQLYLVPLWHKELIYEHQKKEFAIECILDDPEIWIDDENNIHKNQTFSILEIFGKEYIQVFYGKRSFTFSPEILQLKSKQTISWYQCGISKIMPDIHNISKKSDVYLHVYLHHE